MNIEIVRQIMATVTEVDSLTVVESVTKVAKSNKVLLIIGGVAVVLAGCYLLKCHHDKNKR